MRNMLLLGKQNQCGGGSSQGGKKDNMSNANALHVTSTVTMLDSAQTRRNAKGTHEQLHLHKWMS